MLLLLNKMKLFSEMSMNILEQDQSSLRTSENMPFEIVGFDSVSQGCPWQELVFHYRNCDA